MFSDTLSGDFAIGHNITRLKSETTGPVLISVFPLQFATGQITFDERAGGQILNTRVHKTFDRGELLVTWDRYFSPSSLGAPLEAPRNSKQRLLSNLERSYRAGWRLVPRAFTGR